MNLFESINKGFDKKYGKLSDEKVARNVKKEADEDGKPLSEEKSNKRYDKSKVFVKESKGCPSARWGKGAIIKEYKDMGQDLGEYQKWVDYDVERYHKISDKTMVKLRRAGLSVVKDQYGEYEVIAKSPIRDSYSKHKLKEYKDMGQDLGEYQKWVDYDMKRYHRISDKTLGEIKKAGLSVVKDQYGEYEVIANKPDTDVKESKQLPHNGGKVFKVKSAKKINEVFDKSYSEELHRKLDEIQRKHGEEISLKFSDKNAYDLFIDILEKLIPSVDVKELYKAYNEDDDFDNFLTLFDVNILKSTMSGLMDMLNPIL